jgi:hypothetical protein
MRPIMSDNDYNELVELTEKFQKGTGLRLQRYLWVKSLLSTNYVINPLSVLIIIVYQLYF